MDAKQLEPYYEEIVNFTNDPDISVLKMLEKLSEIFKRIKDSCEHKWECKVIKHKTIIYCPKCGSLYNESIMEREMMDNIIKVLLEKHPEIVLHMKKAL